MSGARGEIAALHAIPAGKRAAALARMGLAAVVLAAALGAAAATGPAPQDAASPPNIVFILIDDLGWRDAGFMGSSFYETPNVDRLAAEGMVFRAAYANGPNCAPTRASLMAGQYTPRHGIYTVAPAARGASRLRKLLVEETETELDLDVVTLAEALRGAGYATASVGKWHLGGGRHLPTAQGFDVNVGGNARGAPPSYFWPYERENRQGDVVRIRGLAESGGEGEYLTDRLTDEALEWVSAHAEDPFFLYLSHYAVHTPIQAKPEIAAKYRAKPGSDGHEDPRYAAMIESVDVGVGRVLGKLEELGLTDETIVVFFSDNGGLGAITSMQPLRGSKGMLYEGGIRVPLIVRWPGHVTPGASDVPVMGADFYPTLLELARAEQPDQVLDGLSLTPLWVGAGSGAAGAPNAAEGSSVAEEIEEKRAALRDRALFWHFPAYLEASRDAPEPFRTTPAGAVRQGRFKLVEFFEDGRRELYDLVADPGERSDLSAAMPERTEALGRLLSDWRHDVNATVPDRPNPEFDPTARR